MSRGYLAFVLHAHLPFVRHPEYDDFLEERWFFEAITETYIPLIKFFRSLAADRVPFQVTLSVSPSLLSMMEDALLQERYRCHLGKLIRLAESERDRTQHEPHIHWLAGMYRALFSEALELFESCGGRISRLLRQLQDAGVVELITTTATHGILPLLMAQPKTVHAQLETGLGYFDSVFGFRPKGLWLPECAWAPGLDSLLRTHGIQYFIVESIAVDHASVRPFHGVNAPLYTPQGVAAFARDQGSTREVWSAREGFPGDPAYREFYRDIGHDLDFNYIEQFMGGGVRSDTGIKYHRITGATACKQLYNPDEARDKAAWHAGEFVNKRRAHIDYLHSASGSAPIITAPFDAELFGHWWFEGPQWLNFVIRKIAYDQDSVELITPSNFLRRHPVQQMGNPAASTWGRHANFETWLNGHNDWIYNHLLGCGSRMLQLANRQKTRIPTLTKRALNQCVRELLLAQSSDWPFIITDGTSAEYAQRRVRDHVGRFHFLADAIENNAIDETYLASLEYADNIFPKADFRIYRDDTPTPNVASKKVAKKVAKKRTAASTRQKTTSTAATTSKKKKSATPVSKSAKRAPQKP